MTMKRRDDKRELSVMAGQAKVTDPKSVEESGTADPPVVSLSRRGFLSRATASTAVAAAAMSVPSLLSKRALASQESESHGIARIAQEAEVSDGRKHHGSRRERVFRTRIRAATAEFRVPVPHQVNNGDEVRYPNRIGNFSKGLPHDDLGEVDSAAYDALLTAIASGDPDDFESIPLGGTVKLANPQAGLAFDLEGTDGGQLTLPPAPALASAERAGEMVEDYWMALAREIPFSQYGREPITAAAIAELNALSDFRGPKVNGQVTPGTLFRGSTAGDLIGPYISQFLLLPVKFGGLSIAQRYETYRQGVDYLTDFGFWRVCQDGRGPFAPVDIAGTSYVKNGRDLGSYDHVDFAAQANVTAAFWLAQNGAPTNPGNPYRRSTNQNGSITFGNFHIHSLLSEVWIAGLKAAFFQKWFVHRALRPEAYGGLVHNTLTQTADYPLHGDVLNSQAVSEIFSRHGTYLLPQGDPEGCPQHPAYPAAHAVTAGSTVTVLKAFYDENFVIRNPMVPSDDGQSLMPYTGEDADQITVGGELNKVANNIALGRDIEGLHWRSDGFYGLLLGEAVAISVMRDQHHLFNEHFSGLTFTKFDGTTITV
jgi:hypothetical protein